MVQTLMIESFESTRSIIAVGREAIGLRPDYILKTDLREFQAMYDDANDPVPTILVRMNAKLVQMPERRIIAARTVEREVEAESSRLADIITAFDTALGRVLKEIVVFTLTTPPPTRPAPLSAKPGATDPG
jgi:cholesterol transport system auxiliary component